MTYEVGRYYDVPHIRCYWPDGGNVFNPQWIPVLGPLHTDREIIGFLPQHWHVDFRFLRKAIRQKFGAMTYDSPGDSVFALPISRVVPEGLDTWDPEGNGDQTERSLFVDDLAKYDVKRDSYFRLKRSLCKVDYPEYPHPMPWQTALEDAYAGTSLKDGLICPHKGADLSTFTPDSEDCVTCPLHGLRWNVVTGKLAPAPRISSARINAKKRKPWLYDSN